MIWSSVHVTYFSDNCSGAIIDVELQLTCETFFGIATSLSFTTENTYLAEQTSRENAAIFPDMEPNPLTMQIRSRTPQTAPEDPEVSE